MFCSCPSGFESSHPSGIQCKRPRLEQWSVESGSDVGCIKSEMGFNDHTERCGRLRDHAKTSWILDVENLNVECADHKRKQQHCKFSCSNGRQIKGTNVVTCYRNENGIFLTDVPEIPSCK